MRTKIRPYFKNRQAFPVQIVFGFCLGARGIRKSHKLLCVSRLPRNNSAASHGGFEKKCEKNHHPRDLPTLPHWCRPAGAGLGFGQKKGRRRRKSPAAPSALVKDASYRRFARRMIASWISM
jgi:hypothetical protein